MTATILGMTASLRNARWGRGSRKLVADLETCATEKDLKAYLKSEADLHLQNFVDAGRAEGLTFDQIYKALRKLPGDRGLSNSEVALAAALWSARHAGCNVEHLSLSEFFPAAGKSRSLDRLRQMILDADGLILSSPVYFGDRSSVSAEVINFIRSDAELRENIQGKIYSGIAVGAKRNGGQETTLIYQLFDMLNVGFLGVGNDSDTTAQYGGTGHAGDIGTMAADEYGLNTSMGVGRRIAQVTQFMDRSRGASFRGPLRVQFWILQDKEGRAEQYVQRLIEQSNEPFEASIVNLTESRITRCIACDICPTHVSLDSEYRCIIPPGAKDELGDLHGQFLQHDVIIPVVYTSENREGLSTRYQEFIERTRYLRRGDYVFSNVCVCPLILAELGFHENMALRSMTSLLRHHTVMGQALVDYLHDGKLLNTAHVEAGFRQFIRLACQLTAGQLVTAMESMPRNNPRYNPVGYILSLEKDAEDNRKHTRDDMIADRKAQRLADAYARLEPPAEEQIKRAA